MNQKSKTNDIRKFRRNIFLQQLNLRKPSLKDGLDRLQTLAERLVEVPLAVISFVDDNHVRLFSSKETNSVKLPKNESMAVETISQPTQPTIVEDFQEDTRIETSKSQLHGVNYRSYAGIPITIDGFAIGSFSVWTRDPRCFSGDEVEDLQLVSEQLVDLLEREQTQDGLPLKYRAIDQLDHGLIITDPGQEDNPICFANDGFLQLTGYKHAEVIGENCRFLQGDGTDDETVSELRRAIDQGDSVTTTIKNYRKDGTPFWNELSIKPLRNENDDVDYFVGIQKDVTDKVEKQTQLQALRERFSVAVDAANTGVWELDPNHEKVEYDRSFRRLFGLKPDKVEYDYEAFLDRLHPDDRKRFDQKLQDSLEAKEDLQAEIRFIAESGETKWCETRATIIVDEQETVQRMVGAVIDITNRKNIEQKMKKRDEFLQRLNKLTTDPDGTLEMKIKNILQESKEYFGFDAGFLTRVKDDNSQIFEYTVGDTGELQSGDSFEPGNVHCEETLTLDEPLALSESEQIREKVGEKVYGHFKWGSYLGGNLEVGGETYGTVFFASHESREQGIPDVHKTDLEHVLRWVQFELERNQRMQELEKSREQFQSLFEQANEAIFIESLSDEILRVNQQACELLGYDREQLESMTVPEIQAPEVRSRSGTIHEELTDHESGRFESIDLHKDGSRIPVEISETLIDYGGRKVVLSHVRDISDRKQAEQDRKKALEKLRQTTVSRNRLDEILSTLPGALIITDQEGVIERVNRVLVDLVDIPAEELVGRSINTLFARQEYSNSMVEQLETTNFDGREMHLTGSDGQTIPVLFFSNRLDTEEGDQDGFVCIGSDLRELKQATRQLELFREIMSESPSEIHIVDPSTGEILDVNQTFVENHGYDRDQIIGKKIHDIDPNVGESLGWDELIKELKTEGSIVLETEHLRKDGDTYPVEVRASYREVDGEPYLATHSIDITDRKEQEEKLRKSERKFRSIFHSSFNFIGLLEPDGTLKEVNERSLEFGDVKREQVVGKKFWNTPWWGVHEEDTQRLKESISRASDGEFVRYETDVYAKGRDEIRTIDFSLTPSTDDLGNVELIIPEGRDITERKRARVKLAESQERFEQLANQIDEIFWVARPDWSRFEYVNPAYEELVGHPPNALLESHPADFLEGFHPADRERTEKMMEQLSRGQDVDFEVRANPDEDYDRWLAIQGKPVLDEEDEVTRIIGTAQDITSLKEIQQDLEETLSERETLIQEIHHRVKNNLQVVSSLLGMRSAEIDDPVARQQIEETLSRVNSMAMVHRLLYSSSNMEDVNFKQYTDQLLRHLIRTFKPDQLELTSNQSIDELSIDLDTAVPCGLILTELVSNSLQHGFEGRSSGRLTIEFHKSSNEYELIVRDNGNGLPDDFDPQNVDSLGYELVRAMVRSNLQGELNVESEDGTTVMITFEK